MKILAKNSMLMLQRIPYLVPFRKLISCVLFHNCFPKIYTNVFWSGFPPGDLGDTPHMGTPGVTWETSCVWGTPRVTWGTSHVWGTPEVTWETSCGWGTPRVTWGTSHVWGTPGVTWETSCVWGTPRVTWGTSHVWGIPEVTWETSCGWGTPRVTWETSCGWGTPRVTWGTSRVRGTPRVKWPRLVWPHSDLWPEVVPLSPLANYLRFTDHCWLPRLKHPPPEPTQGLQVSVDEKSDLFLFFICVCMFFFLGVSNITRMLMIIGRKNWRIIKYKIILYVTSSQWEMCVCNVAETISDSQGRGK